MGTRLTAFLLVLLALAGCGPRIVPLEAQEIILLRSGGQDLLPQEHGELVEQLVQAFNSARVRSRTRSGPATHRLTLVTGDERVIHINRVSEALSEVVFISDTRHKLFLFSPELAEQVEEISALAE